MLTTAAEVHVVDVTWPVGDVIEACNCDVTSAEEAGRSEQDTLEPASAAVARQRVAFHAAVVTTTITQRSLCGNQLLE